MTIMLDTSALVAMHTSRTARTIIHDAIKGDSDWCASALALTEAMSIIDRMSEQEFVRHDLEDAIRHTWDYVSIVPVDQRCLDEAAILVRQQPLHISDAIHLAAATRLPKPIKFVTFDPAQIPVALSLGFDVVSS